MTHIERWQRLKRREVALGVRSYDGWRQTHPPGERVLLVTPALEGTVISYRASKKTTGGASAAEAIVRWADGSEGLVSGETLVALRFEESSDTRDDELQGLHGVDRRALPHPATKDRAGRMG